MIYRRGSLPNIYLQHQKSLRKVDDDLFRYLNEQDENLGVILDRGITFEENVDGVFVTYTSNGAPDTEDTVTHTLNRAPVGFIVTDINKGAVIYRSGTSTKTSLLLKCNVASTTATLFVF